MPLSQTRNEHEKPKETVQKTKRCGSQHRKNRFLLLSTKEDSNRAKSTDRNINVGISKQNSDDYTLIKNAKYSQENSATSKKIVAETHEDEIRTFKDDLNEEDVIINKNYQEKKKCNTEKCICHCKEDCVSSSSKKSSSRILGSSKIDKPERTNHRRLTKYENAKPNNLQQKLPKLYYESPHELHVPNLINYLPIQPYQEKMNNIPSVPVLYEITPNIPPHIVENKGKYVNVGMPFTSFEGRPNYLVGINNQQIIHQKPYICSPITGKHQIESSVMSVTSPSTNYIDATTIKETINDLESNNPIDITGEDQEHFPELITEASNIDASADSETETNLQLNYSTDVTEESNAMSSVNLNKVMHKSEDFTEQTEKNPDNNLSKLMTYSTDYVDIRSTPSIIFDGMNDGKLINMEECIQLFGRDVCVLSATSPRMLAKQAQTNNLNKYTTIRIPEYVTQISTRKETLNNINYSDKFKTTDSYFASKSSINEMNKLNVNSNEYLESTSTKSNDVDEVSLREFHQYPESTKQMSEPDNKNDDKNKSFSIIKNTDTPIKKLMNPINEAVKTEKNKVLGKSKSHTTKLLLNPNDEEITNSTPDEKFFYSTSSYESSNDEEASNLKVTQQNRITNTNSTSHTSPEEDTTVISYDKTGYDSKEQNYLKESNTDIYSGKKAPQEDFKEETTTTSSNSKTGYNFEEETKKEIIGIKASVHPGEIHQEQSTTMQYFDDKKSNNKEDTTNNLEAIIESSTSKLPFCDNTLLLNSIRKVINDFASDARLTKTNLDDLDENSLQTQGKSLLSEILQVPNLKNILSTPQIENTIVEKVKDVLSYVTAIPRKDFTNKWSHGVIRNTLHSILDTFSNVHHKLPPMTLEEHQFKDGHWTTDLVTLAPVLDQKLLMAIPNNMRESIKDLLSSSAIASQTDQYIVRNMIVQSVKNSLTNDKDDKIDDSIIHALNDVLGTFKNSENINALERSNEVISDEEDMDMTLLQEMSTSNYEIGINVDNSMLDIKQNLDVNKDIKMDSERMQTTDYQKAEILENNANILITSERPYLLQLYEEEKGKEEKEETTNKAIAKENIKDQNLYKIKEINVQDDAEEKLAESLKPKITYHKAILQNNPSVLATFEPNSTEAEEYTEKNYRIDEESVKDTSTITNFMQEISPSYVQVSDGIILENTVGAKNIGEQVQHTSNEKTLTTSTNEIDPLIILERIKFNLPPTKYYSPEVLKHVTNHRIDDKNVEITTASTNFIQKTSSNYAQASDGMVLQNVTEIKDEMKYPLTTTSDNLISSANVECRDCKPKVTYLTDKNILESQQQNFTEDNVIKIHEVTTEVQRTYAKTTYFKAGPYSDDSPRISSSIASDDISELQKSQLYYISDGVKLPLEIKRLKDGSYALSISKNVCEQILTRKCPCCVPLQGYIVSLKNHQQEDMHAMTSTTVEKKDQENMYVNNIKRDYQSDQPFSSIITRRNALKTQKSKEEEKKEAEEGRINAHYLWKQNDDNRATIPMPVIDFAKKYNLLLDFNEEGILLSSSLKSVKGFEHDQSEERNLNNNYPDIKKNRLGENNDAIDKSQDLINVREKKNIPNFSIFPITRKLFNLGKNSEEFEVQKANAEMNQSEIDQESKLRRVKIANDVQNMNIVQKINSKNQEKMNPVLEGINTSEETKISKEETKWNKLSNNVEGNYHIITHNKIQKYKENNFVLFLLFLRKN